MPTKPRPLQERWAEKVAFSGPDDCWLWTATPANNGYGRVRGEDGNDRLAHRVAYELFVGAIPDGYVIDHICHIPLCVNPRHLEPVTSAANTQNRAGIQKNNRSGVRGVYWKKGKWEAAARIGGKPIYGGRFTSLVEAEAAAIALRARLGFRDTTGNAA